ncbi:tripartite tricarboxylate transporter TctB family protein [Plantactinospora sp. KLBMP9567]|uniref:tripartite tricarboxylate transporter TctB family protein n=1 Tax=Plantactinospora sp. KLBMP9567 TaxID=3085900 RepID=UPI0029811819|nr:tripartite tricarboxylate transporter TctB family protein [Plantactinospora sp. KLBMP9567]MDW5330195.1 tripartite tricarboxylate transporter TctB family protein [Plantactinospora sp. KLBMP9567]
MPSESQTGAGAVEPAGPVPAPRGARVLGAVLLAGGLFLFWTAYRAAGGDYSVSGPWLAPLVVTTGWVVLAGWYLLTQFRIPARVEPTGAGVPDRSPGTLDEPTADQDAPAGQTGTAEQNAEAEHTGTAERNAEPAAAVRWLPPVLLGAALLGYVLLLGPAGFVLASALFFVACARILGSRHWLRDVVVGVPLAVGVYYGFTRGLDITLPAGVLPL